MSDLYICPVDDTVIETAPGAEAVCPACRLSATRGVGLAVIARRLASRARSNPTSPLGDLLYELRAVEDGDLQSCPDHPAGHLSAYEHDDDHHNTV